MVRRHFCGRRRRAAQGAATPGCFKLTLGGEAASESPSTVVMSQVQELYNLPISPHISPYLAVTSRAARGCRRATAARKCRTAAARAGPSFPREGRSAALGLPRAPPASPPPSPCPRPPSLPAPPCPWRRRAWRAARRRPGPRYREAEMSRESREIRREEPRGAERSLDEPSFAGDLAEIWPRCVRDVSEMWARCGRDVSEMCPRCVRDVAEMWPR